MPLILAIITGVVLAIKAGQDQNWDLLNYHFYNPYAFLHGLVNKNLAPSQIQTFINPIIDVPSYLFITNLKPIIAGSFMGAVQGLNLWLIYEITLVFFLGFFRKQNYKTYTLAFVIALASFFGAINLLEIGATPNDNTTSIFILASLLLLLLVISKTNKWISSHSNLVRFIAYALSGVALGLKLTVAPFVIALLVIEIVNYKNSLVLIKREMLNVAGLVAGFIVSYGYWAIYLLKNYKNPFFPYFNNLFHSPYFPNQNFYGIQYFPHGLLQTVFYPIYFMRSQHLVNATSFRDPRLGALYITLIVLVAYVLLSHFIKKIPKPKVTKEIIALWLFIIVSYVVWEKLYSYYRYLEVLEFLSIMAITITIWSIVRSKRIAIPLSLLVVLLIVFTTSPINYPRIHWQSSWFGAQVPAKFIKPNSTVLMTGDEPLSFLIPFFPSSANFIRTQGNIYEPGPPSYPETSAYKQLVNSAVINQQRRQSNFYALETADDVSLATTAINQYHFKVSSCQPIYTYVSKYLDKNNNYYELCKLN